MSDQLKGILYASITSLFWGFLAVALKIGTGEFNITTIVWFRFTFAFTILFSYFLITDYRKLKVLIKPPFTLLIAALAIAINYFGFTKGIELTSPTTAQVVIQFGPILLGMVGILFFKEKINKRQASGFFIAFLGLVMFYYQQVSNLIASDAEIFNTGFIWVAIAAVAWVIYASFQKMLVKSYDAQILNLVIFGLPALLYLPFVDFNDLHHISIPSWWLLIFLGANTIVAYGSLAMAFKYTDLSKVSVIITLNPIITFIIMAILYQLQVEWIETKQMGLETWAGAFFVITGALIVVYFKSKPKHTK